MANRIWILRSRRRRRKKNFLKIPRRKK